MPDLLNMTPDEVRALDTDTLIEAIAQRLYDQAQYASNRSDSADQEGDTESSKLWDRECQALCAAAEHVRDVLRD